MFLLALNRATEGLSRLLFALGGALIVAILALTLGNIVLRLCGMPMRGVIEISGYLGAAAIGLCLPRAQLAGSHIEAGMLDESLPPFARRVIRIAVLLISVAFMLLAADEMLSLGLFVHEMDELIDGWDFSYAPLVFALALGCFGQTLVLVNDLIQTVRTAPATPHQVNVLKVREEGAGGICS